MIPFTPPPSQSPFLSQHHFCVLFQSSQERASLLRKCLNASLAKQARVLMITNQPLDASSLDWTDAHLIRAALLNGQIVQISPAVVAQNEANNSDQVVIWLSEQIRSAHNPQQEMLVVIEMQSLTGDNIWIQALREKVGQPILDLNLPGVTFGCLFDRHQFTSARLLEALLTFPYLVTNEGLVENFYFIPWAEWHQRHRTEAILNHWLPNLNIRQQEKLLLQENRELLQVVIDSLPVYIALIDDQQRFKLVNQAYATLYERRKDELIGIHIQDLIDPPAYQRALPYIHQVLRGESTRYENIFREAHGSARIMQVQLVPHLDADNQVIGYITLMQDVTQERQAETSLKISESRYRAIVEDQTELICRFRVDGGITFVNGAFCRFYNLSQEDALKQTSSILGRNNDSVYIGESDLQIGPANPTITYETRVFGRDGSAKWLQWTERGLFTDEGVLLEYQAVGRDITERYQMEAALRDNEARYRSLVENQGEGIATVDENDIFEYVNYAAEILLGAAPGAMTGRPVSSFLNPIQQQIVDQQNEMRKAGQASSYELEVMRMDGQLRQFLITSTPRFDSSGEFRGAFIVFRDITDRKNWEEKLRYQSTHDILTGLHNRAFFDEEVARLERGRQYPISFIMVDVDNLKMVNDGRGHPAGDELLRRVSAVLRSSFRSEDVIARIGGDEFIVLLPNTNRAALTRAIRRLQTNLTHTNQSCSQCEPLSFSVGGSTAPIGNSLQRAIHRADENMYRNKRNRRMRNQVPSSQTD